MLRFEGRDKVADYISEAELPIDLDRSGRDDFLQLSKNFPTIKYWHFHHSAHHGPSCRGHLPPLAHQRYNPITGKGFPGLTHTVGTDVYAIYLETYIFHL